MDAKSLETWSWVLIYGGLLLLSLGLFFMRSSLAMGWGLVMTGVVLAAAGVVLIFKRAQLPETDDQNMPPRKE